MNARFAMALLAACLCVALVACGGQPQQAAESPAAKPAAPPPAAVSDPAPPPEQTGGFDGARAFAHVERLVGFGPRPPGSEGIRRAQGYIREQLEGFGCAVEEDAFTAQTPVGPLAMKNIVAKVPGKKSDVILLLTHYDTLRKEGFLGANDGGSSTGVMLELARLLCAQPRQMTVWIAFLDGEEAQVQWSETDSLYGSRQMAARLALSGELKRVRAAILADMVGDRELRFKREGNSTKWLVDLVWSAARRLGYGDIFVDETHYIDDDHLPFIRRGVAAVDIVEVDEYPYWHTLEDTLDKISPRSLAVTGHVILESLAALERRFR